MEIARPFKKRTGTFGISGQLYEIKLLTWFLLEATQRKDVKKINNFYLASNLAEAQMFDDLVFKYNYTDKNDEEKSSIIFLQARHTEKKERKISVDALLSTTDRGGDFSLRKYLTSFIKIKQQFSQKSLHPIFQGRIEECEFIIYTNALLDFKKSREIAYPEHIKQEHFLNVAKNKNYYYKFSDTKELVNVLKSNLDFEILTKSVAQSIAYKTVDMNKAVIADYHYALAETVFERINRREGILRKSFFDDQYLEFRDATVQELEKQRHFPNVPYDQLKDYLLQLRINLPERFGIIAEDDLKLPLPKKLISDDDIKTFLNEFKLFACQPGESELTEIIKNKIKMIYETDQNDVDVIFSSVEYKVRSWWRDDSTYLTELNTFFHDSAKVSIYFDVKQPTDFFTGRKRELAVLHESIRRNRDEITVVSQMTTISGLGGIGKTELARQYIKEYSDCYDNNIIWIDAENDRTITESFLSLAEDQLRIPTRTVDGNIKKVKYIAEGIFRFFSKRKSLFVFDNVEDGDVNKFLPMSSLKPNDHRPHVLITSRRREWEKGVDVIDLNVLTVNEAIELVKNSLDIEDDEDIEKLVNKLQCYPLAIRQAIGYIENERLLDDYTIADYLRELENNFKDLVDFQLFEGINNDYTKTTYTSWAITIDKISQENSGQLALKLLNIMAFIASENINREMFLGLPDVTEKQLKASVRLLIKYSMINGEQKQSILTINTLVQEVIRLQIVEHKRELEIINESCMVLKQFFPYGSDLLTDLKRKRLLLPHIETIISHIDNYFSNKKIGHVALENMLTLLCDVYNNFDPQNQKRILERILKINIENCGLYEPQTIETMINLSIANKQFGDYQSQKKLLEQALKIQEKHGSVNGLEVAKTLSLLGNIYDTLGDYQKEKEVLENVFELQVKHYGPDHSELVKTLTNLSVVYWKLGYPAKQKELLENALRIQEQHYGPDHIEVASILTNLAISYKPLGDALEQIELLKRALMIQIKHFGPKHYKVSIALINLSSVYRTLGKFLKQIELLEQALEIYKNRDGPDHFEIFKIFSQLGNAYGNLGKLDRQRELLHKALQLCEEYYGPDHFEVCRVLINLSNAYGKLGKSDKQKQLLKRAVENLYGSNHFSIPKILVNLGTAYGNLGEPSKQEELLKRALVLSEKHFGIDHFETALISLNLSVVYGILGNLTAQEESLAKALKIYEKHYGPDHHVSKLLANIHVHGDLKDSEKQKELLETILQWNEKLSIADDYEMIY